VEKSIILADLGDWDQALDTAQRVLDMEPKNVVALDVRHHMPVFNMTD